jgi:penicillin-binding protein 2
MRKRLSIKNHQQETQLFNARSLAAFIFVLCCFVTLFLRISYLQIIHHTKYSTLSRQNLLEILPFEPNRGLIYDRNGILLAKNTAVFTLNIIPAKVNHIDKTILALTKLITLSDTDIKNFHHALFQHRPYESIPLKIKLSEKERAIFYINRYRFPGVNIQTHMLRHYPQGKDISNVIGYVGRLNTKELKQVDPINYSASDYIGKTGIEKFYENLLHGKVGMKEVEINANGHIVRQLKTIPPQAGSNLYLTIDSQLQTYAEKALGDNNGAVVAIQPSTGQILALVTKPNFDPNLFVNGISHRDYEKLSHSPDHPLFNRAIRGQYSPGSTIKPFIAITGLNNDTISTQSTVYDPGWFRLPHTKHIYHDWKHAGHGWVNITKAIMVSCDTFFYQLSVNLGIHAIDTMLSQFGFGHSTQIDMPEELAGLVPNPTWKQRNSGYPWYTGDTILTGIGQGFLLTTPLQLAEGVSIIAEHGAHYQPHLLLATQQTNQTKTFIKTIENPPLILKHPDVWHIVIQAMQGVISNPHGTAIGFGRHPGYSAAAKTGTAQVYGKQRDEERSRMNIPKRLRNNHLFIVFAPVNNPQIALVTVIEHASYADRVARKITDFYLHHCLKHDKVARHESSNVS